jgi:hypothetical protein
MSFDKLRIMSLPNDGGPRFAVQAELFLRFSSEVFA